MQGNRKKKEEEEKFKNSQTFSFAHPIASENFQFENTEMEEYTSLNIPSRCSNTIEESFLEFQEIGTSAIDPSSARQFDFDFEQSKLQINYVHSNSVTTELKQNTTNEILVGESVPGLIMEPTSDLNLGTVSWNIDYNLENSSDRLGLLSLSQFDLFPSKQKTALQKETWLDAISGKESETKSENVEPRNIETQNIAMLGFTSPITAPTKGPRMKDRFMETQTKVYSALDSFVQLQADFHADQSNLSFHFNDPKSVSPELMQESTDEKLFGESALRYIDARNVALTEKRPETEEIKVDIMTCIQLKNLLLKNLLYTCAQVARVDLVIRVLNSLKCIILDDYGHYASKRGRT
ncbi:hypothetical protein TNCT_245331 [Trichonephila clavata]|uniref:Uncharacterized protein n=1 Tax=Trichonephila clavata TaxID=2740835 RepID=A0A8X6JBU4_TRICU|nr:hypothetical protein TNCT_245331 [Trichonephila clavata]